MGDLACPAPWLGPHYRAFIATTGWSASVPRIGTLPHVALATRGSPSRRPGSRQHPCNRSFVSRRQILLFHARACNELTPPLHRTPPGPRAGSSLAPDTPEGRALVPRRDSCPGFDVVVHIFDASAVVYTCSSSRRSPDPLVAGLLPSRFPPRLLTGMTLRRFGISACSANPEGLPPSLTQHGSCWRSSTSSSLPFQDTPVPMVPNCPTVRRTGAPERSQGSL